MHDAKYVDSVYKKQKYKKTENNIFCLLDRQKLLDLLSAATDSE
jgi:hypothetical protein